MSPSIILLAGAPGIGKSTTARLAAASRRIAAVIEVDEVRKMVCSTDWMDQKQHTDALSFAEDMAVAMVARQYMPVMIVDTFSNGRLPQSFRRLTALRITTIAVVLAASPEVLKTRIRERPDGKFKNEPIALALNEQMLATRRTSHAIYIDTSDLLPTIVARYLLEHVHADAFTYKNAKGARVNAKGRDNISGVGEMGHDSNGSWR